SLFLLGLTLGALTGWSLAYGGVMVAGLLSLLLFVYLERKVRYPMMDLTLFRIRDFSSGIFSNLLASVSRGAISLVLVFYFQGALGLDALTAGLLLIPFSIAFVMFGPLSGSLSDKYGARSFSTVGLLISFAAFFWFAIFPFGASYSLLVLPMILAGAGAGIFVAPNAASIMNAAPVNRRGIASGMSSTLVNTGSLLSLGMAFAIMAANVPISTLQAIFAGVQVQLDPTKLDLFINSMRKIFLLMGIFSLVAALASSMRGPRGAQPSEQRGID
ncbi:MAG TPA: MFS transporter, partial [Nitrososphaerales archaeon]|nr:MFS transporter [Nitrososphaerales archaeon]